MVMLSLPAPQAPSQRQGSVLDTSGRVAEVDLLFLAQIGRRVGGR